MLAIRVNPSSGVPVFVARLVPVRNLTTDYLFEIVKSFMKSFMMPEIEFLVSCATILQKTYKMLLEDFDSLSVASVARLCEISKFKVFFSRYLMQHISLKTFLTIGILRKSNIRIRKSSEHRKCDSAKWNDFKHIYEKRNIKWYSQRKQVRLHHTSS